MCLFGALKVVTPVEETIAEGKMSRGAGDDGYKLLGLSSDMLLVIVMIAIVIVYSNSNSNSNSR